MAAGSSISTDQALAQLDAASAAQKLSASAAEHIRAWLTEPRYAAYAPQVAEHIAAEKWPELNDVFWTVIPFGTGGRRGRMYPFGTNAINDRTIGESAQGLADYVQEQAGGGELSCAIAYDTRHNSRHFAELCAGVMVAAGYKVYFLDDYRSTPELSFLVRFKHCSCGIMVTASHNPPSDNAVKVYWSTGGQILPPHDARVIDRVMTVEQVAVAPFAQAVADGRVVICTAETDAAYQAAVLRQACAGPRDVRVLYSPLHGVGASAVMPALAADGFADAELFALHAEPSGDFPNVPGNVSNPENVRVFDAIIARARESGADLALASDPDADRLGCAAPLTTDRGGEWRPLTGNQIGALLCDFVLDERKRSGRLSGEHYIVTTVVTTGMLRRIADSYGVRTFDNLQVGFKWIGGVIDEAGPERFAFGAEESHGYLVGDYARDKDGVVAALLMAELAAKVKAAGQSLWQKLEALYWQHGYHVERQVNVTMPGQQGMGRMERLMQSLRERPPTELAGLAVRQARDYQHGVIVAADGSRTPFDGAPGNLVILDLAAEGNYVAVRPSGTEPKVKFYLFAFEPAEMLGDLAATDAELNARLDAVARDLSAYADAIE